MNGNGAPELSIIVVNWNTRALLLRLLAQLLPAGGPPIDCEVLVVDNDSQDGSAEAARAAHPEAIVLPQPRNGGFAYGVNRGLLQARGRWLLLLNTDTEVDWPRLQQLLRATAAAPRGAVFGPRIVDAQGRPQVSHWPAPRPRHYLSQALGLVRRRPPAPATAARPVDTVSGCAFLIRRDALLQVGGMDERFFLYFEETDLCARLRARGWQVIHLPEPTLVHAGGLSAGQAAERTFLAFRESCLLFHATWHGRLATEWVRGCLLLGCALRLGWWLARRALGGPRRAHLYWRALRMLARPGLVAQLARQPRAVPQLSPA